MISIYPEKRDTIRVRSIHLLSYSQLDERETVRDIGMARTLNVSERGILFESQKRFEVGTELEIMLNVAEECIIAKGKVMREVDDNGRFRIAVRFTHLSSESYGVLARYLNSNFPYTRYYH